MKNKILTCVFCVSVCLPQLFAWPNPVDTQTDNALTEGMLGLYNSAQKLSMGNSVLAVHVKELNMKLNALQLRYQQFIAENNRLSNEALKLQENDPINARKITTLEKEIFDLDAKMEDMKLKLKSDADALDSFPAQELRLNARLNELGVVEKPVEPALTASKQKMQLLKLIAESKEKQEKLYSKLVSNDHHQPIVRIEAPGQKANLLTSIRQTQDDIDQINRMGQVRPDDNIDLNQLKQLQAEVNVLQKNHDELERLMLKMQEKNQEVQKKFDQRAEYTRLKENLDQSNKEAKALKLELSDLRFQMVELDKRKIYLDSMIKK